MLTDLELELDQRIAGGFRNDSMMSCRQQALKTKFSKHGRSYLCIRLCKYFREFEIVGWRFNILLKDGYTGQVKPSPTLAADKRGPVFAMQSALIVELRNLWAIRKDYLFRHQTYKSAGLNRLYQAVELLTVFIPMNRCEVIHNR